MKLGAVRSAFVALAGRDRKICPACRHRILPGQRTERVGDRAYHRACARYG